MKHPSLIVGVLAMSLSMTSVVTAEGYNPVLDDKWRVYVGAFNASVNSQIRINSDLFPGVPPLDVEDLLGLPDSKTVPWGGVTWNFATKHSLEFEMFNLNRNYSQAASYSPPIHIGDLFIEDGQVTTSYDTNLARLTYGYSILRSDRYKLQIQGGLHVATLNIDVQLAGAVCTPSTVPAMPPGCPTDTTGDDAESVTAPLPHIGLSYSYAFTPTVAMNLGVKGFAIEVDNIDGSIVEVDADIGWQPFEHIGFGLGVRYFDAKVESSTDRLNGMFEFDYLGPTIYVHATF